MSNEARHTPVPWRVGRSNGHFDIFTQAGELVAAMNIGHIAGEEKANAAFIVRAVNVHDDLVAALEAMVAQLEWWPGEKNPEGFACMKQARAALAKAQNRP